MGAAIASFVVTVIFVIMAVNGTNSPAPVQQEQLPPLVYLGGPLALLFLSLGSIAEWRIPKDGKASQ